MIVRPEAMRTMRFLVTGGQITTYSEGFDEPYTNIPIARPMTRRAKSTPRAIAMIKKVYIREGSKMGFQGSW